MRTIERSSAFKRDYKREAKGKHRTTLDADLMPVLAALASDRPLQVRHRDHDLSSNWAGYRECHVKPDLLLIDLSQTGSRYTATGPYRFPQQSIRLNDV